MKAHRLTDYALTVALALIAAGCQQVVITETPPAQSLLQAQSTVCVVTRGRVSAAAETGLATGTASLSLLAPNSNGVWLEISGMVYASGCAAGLTGAKISVRHADKNGVYGRFHGVVVTDATGHYAIETFMPGRYGQGEDLLPAHIHFTVEHPEAKTLSGEITFEGDPYLDHYPEASANIINLWANEDGAWFGDFNIVLPDP